uniref:uncharacterized protein LOC120329867 n=1 Tax=Styela clava TaxID=7725 RepID=UPI001939880E|nr:uncharacterized protein LOC120329867 [Styela clava]
MKSMTACVTLLLYYLFFISQVSSFKDYVLRDLGCWQDKGARAIPSIETKLHGSYKSRVNAIQQCAHAAKILGYSVFAIQDGGWCASGSAAFKTYTKYGPSDKCKSDGKGGPWANQVYEIDTVLKVQYRPVGCFKDTGKRAIDTVEKRYVDLHDNYQHRQDAIGKCARIAASLGNSVFALQNGGWCATSSSASSTHNKYGYSQDCQDHGKGGPWANAVYEITSVAKITLERLGCFADKESRSLPFLERPEILGGEYQKRPQAIEQCVRYASGLGHLIVGIQNGGSCMAGIHYAKYGASTNCKSNSKGGSWANEVFKIDIKKLETGFPRLPRHEEYYLNNLGCWTDKENRAIPVGLEGTNSILIGEYQKRKDAIRRCAQAAMARGYNIIGVQNGGQCWTGVNARNTYRKYGLSNKCSNGKGGNWANEVYEINTIWDPNFSGLGCFRDTSARAISTIETMNPLLNGEYQKRSDPVRKCARVSASFGHTVFAIQNGGYCQSSANAGSAYARFGRADNCGRGKGGSWAMSVYKISDAMDFYIESRGCWADDAFRTIPTVESDGPEFMSQPDYKKREDALGKCARYARSRGFRFFALQDGGYCSASIDAENTYRRIGPSQKCRNDGKGGPWANQVYEIVPQKLA